jgi:hypothetical protein
MRHLRRTALAAVAVALCTLPATAREAQSDPGGAVITPASGKLLGEAWAKGFSAPVPDPDRGSCRSIGRGGTVVVGVLGDDETATCEVARGTSVMVFWGFSCTDVFEGVSGEAAQRECAVAGDQTLREINVTVDDGTTVPIRDPRFEVLSPQRTVPLGDGSGPITFVAHGWAALIRNLRPGEHTIEVEVVDDNYQLTYTLFVTVSGHGAS